MLVILTAVGTAMILPAAGEAPPVIDTGTTAWMLVSTALVLLMVPALAMFYGGLVRNKNVLGTMMQSFAAMAIIGVVWTICGYSMSFGASRGWCGWDGNFVLFRGIDHGPGAYYGETNVIPHLVFAMFQGKFAIITPALIAGAFAERVRFGAYCIFIVLWSLFVYNPLAHWVWGGGFLTGEAIDFAGGTVVHISAGMAGLAIALFIGVRRGYPRTAMRPNNLVMTLTGAGLLWVGWFGFNAGSAVSSGLKTAQALTATQIAAATGGLTWILVEFLHRRMATTLGIASGILAGLVVITPAAGAVEPLGALALGCVAAIVCYAAVLLKGRLGYDDALDVFGIHGMAGIVGALGLAFFMRPGTTENSVMLQFWFQAKGVLVAAGYSFVATFALVLVTDRICRFRLAESEEKAGLDHSLHGETGYGLVDPI